MNLRNRPSASAIASFAACLGAVVAFALVCLNIRFGSWDWDAGYYLQISSMIARGLKPYVDYRDMYPPTMQLFNALFLKSPTDREVLIFLIPLIWIFGIAVLNGVLLRNHLQRVERALVTGLFFLFVIECRVNHVTLELAIIFLWLLYLVIDLEFRETLPKYLALGAALSLLVFTKQNAVVALPSCLALTWLRQPKGDDQRALKLRRGLAFAFGFALPVMIFLAYVPAGSFFENTVTDFFAYAQGAPEFHAEMLLNELKRSPYAMLLTGLCFACLAIQILKDTKRASKVVCATFLFAGLAFFGARFYRDYPHYSFNVWPVLLMSITLSPWLRGWIKSSARPFPIAFFLFYGALAGIGERVIRETRSTDDYIVRSQIPIARVLKRDSSVDDRIAVLTGDYIITFLADRLNSELFPSRQRPLCLYDVSRKDCRSVLEDIKGAPWIIEADRGGPEWAKEERELQKYFESKGYKTVATAPFPGGEIRLHRAVK